MKAHEVKALQADWNEHGQASFVFEILDTLAPHEDPAHDPIPDLAVLEDMWLDKLRVTIDPQLSIDPKRVRRA